MRDEQNLIEGLKAGNYEDFSCLYNLYAPRLYAFALSLSHIKEVAEDIVQDTFVKVWLHRSEIKAQSFKAFLFTIARNGLLNVFRENMKMSCQLELDTISENESFAENNGERDLFLKELMEKLRLAKQKLSYRQRMFFELNKEYGLSVNEIAVQTSVSEQYVRNQIYMALKFIRKELGRYYLFLF